MSRLNAGWIEAGRVEIDRGLTGVHPRHIDIPQAVERYPWPIVIAFAAPGLRPDEIPVRVEFGQERIEIRKRAGVVGMIIRMLRVPWIEIRRGAREIPFHINMILRIDGEA